MTVAISLVVLALVACSQGGEYPPYNAERCGYASARGFQHKVMGGTDDDQGRFPNAVAIFRNSVYLCTGSLIAPGYIVTAAHCFTDKVKTPFLSLFCGVDNNCVEEYAGSGNRNRCRGGFFNIEEIKKQITILIGGLPLDSDAMRLPILEVEPSYTRFFHRGCWQHDIAILKTENTDTQMHSCITSRSRMQSIFADTLSIGWGADAIKKLETHNKLQVLQNGIVHTLDQCIKLSNGWFPLDGVCIEEFQDKNLCKGDSGGPLITYEKGYKSRLFTIGVLSFGTNCYSLRDNYAASAAVYTRLDFFSNMINTFLGLDSEYDDLTFTTDIVNFTLPKHD